MNQPNLFDAPYQRHIETSREAAESIEPILNELQVAVWECFKACGHKRGATDHEVQVMLGMNPSTQRPRRIELVGKGLVVAMRYANGQPVKRKTDTGRAAQVWRIK